MACPSWSAESRPATFSKPRARLSAPYFCPHNFARHCKPLRASPAIATGVCDTLLSMEDLIAYMDANAEPPKKRGPYKKKAAV